MPPTSLLSTNPRCFCQYPGRSTNVILAITSSHFKVFLNFRASGVLHIERVIIKIILSLDWQKHFFLPRRILRNLQNVTADQGNTEDPIE